jgi:hypothetical protein
MTESIKPADWTRIKHLLKSDEWDSVLKFFSYKISQWNDEEISGENEFQTLKNLHQKKGKVEGLKEFMNQMEQQALE